MRKTISCSTLPVPSEHCAGRRKEERLARHVFIQMLVWELDWSTAEALRDAHERLQSQGVEHWTNSCLGFLLGVLLHGRWAWAGCSEAPMGSGGWRHIQRN